MLGPTTHMCNATDFEHSSRSKKVIALIVATVEDDTIALRFNMRNKILDLEINPKALPHWKQPQIIYVIKSNSKPFTNHEEKSGLLTKDFDKFYRLFCQKIFQATVTFNDFARVHYLPFPLRHFSPLFTFQTSFVFHKDNHLFRLKSLRFSGKEFSTFLFPRFLATKNLL